MDEEVDSLDGEDAVFARMIPRKANRWIWATIASELLTNVTRNVASALDDVTTVFSQRFNYEDERQGFMSDIGRDIEALEGGFDLVQAAEWEEEGE